MSYIQATITWDPDILPSSESLLSDFKNDEEKQKLNEMLKKRQDSFILTYCIFADMDFSNMYFKGIRFYRCKFNNTDLRDFNFYNVYLLDRDLSNVILYYPDPTASEDEVHKNGFKITDWDPYFLVFQYSDLVKSMDWQAQNITHFFLLHA